MVKEKFCINRMMLMQIKGMDKKLKRKTSQSKLVFSFLKGVSELEIISHVSR